MKTSIAALWLLIATVVVCHAQNKTLGVGTTTPNSNAALHVESPTNNQGFIMPRLTTTQRTAAGFTSILTAADNGLMVYDSDLKAIYIWDGAAWRSSQQVAQANLANQAVKLVLPYADTVASAPANSNLLRIINSGTAVANVGVANFENTNPNNAFTTLFVRNQGTNSAGYFQQLNNASNSAALRGLTNSNTTGGHGVLGATTGTGGSAGSFQINNAASTQSAILSNTNGAGAAIEANTSGAGNAANFGINNATNNVPALNASSSGTGAAANFYLTNASSTAPVVSINHAGTGNAITANRPIQATQFIGDGSLLTGISGGLALPFAQSASAPSPLFSVSQTGTGGAATFENTDPVNGGDALVVTTAGIGPAATFVATNPSNAGPAIGIFHNGTGNAITTNRPIQASQFIGDGSLLTNLPSISFPLTSTLAETSNLFSLTNSGTGSAGRFEINNVANSSAALFATSNGSNGFAIRAINTATSNGFAGLFQNTDASNNFPAIQANTAGTGAGVQVMTSNTSLGGGVNVVMQNTTGSALGLSISQGGLGSAGNFAISNASSTVPAININHSGTGNAITANRPIQATQFIGDGSLLTGLPGGFSTANAIPKGNGSGLVASLLTDDGANVGLGTGTPSTRFHISGGGALQTLRVQNTTPAPSGSNGDANLELINQNRSWTVQSQTLGNFQINDNNAVVTRLHINSVGSVGIGNINPTERLDVTGNLRFSGALMPNNQPGTSGQVLTSAGAGLAPAWAAAPGLTLPYSNSVSSGSTVFDLANTGTGSTFVSSQQGTSGSAGVFNNTNTSNGSPALQVSSAGTGSIAFSSTAGGSTGQAGAFFITNPSNGFVSLQGSTSGTGVAGRFSTTNTANTNPTIMQTHDGLGQALSINLTNASNTQTAIQINHSGTGNALTASRPISINNPLTTGGAGFFAVSNAGNANNALQVSSNGTNTTAQVTHSGTSGAANFEINNSTNNIQAVSATTNGTGSVVSLFSTNGANTQPALNIFHSGTGNAITANRPIEATNIIATGNLNANGLSYTWPGAHAGGVLTNNGTGGLSWAATAGLVLPYTASNSDATSSFAVTNNSTGASLVGVNSGTGYAGEFSITNPASPNAAVRSSTSGTGRAAEFSISNPGNSNTTIYAGTNGSGRAITAYSSGGGGALRAETGGAAGSALTVENTNGANTSALVTLQQASTGSALTSNRDISVNVTTATGTAATFNINNGSNNNTALSASSNGMASAFAAIALGTSVANSAGQFEILNASNGATALRTATNGTGNAFVAVNSGNGGGATIQVTNSANGNPGIQVTHAGEGSGINIVQNKAGGFGPAISAASVGNGPTLSIQQTNNGNALDVQSGGLKLSVATISAGGTITQIAAIYKITTNAAVTLPAATDGQICIVDNSSGGIVTLTGLVAPSAGKFAMYIYLGGWRPM